MNRFYQQPLYIPGRVLLAEVQDYLYSVPLRPLRLSLVRFGQKGKTHALSLQQKNLPPIENETIQTSLSITTMYKEEIYYSGDILDFFRI